MLDISLERVLVAIALALVIWGAVVVVLRAVRRNSIPQLFGFILLFGRIVRSISGSKLKVRNTRETQVVLDLNISTRPLPGAMNGPGLPERSLRIKFAPNAVLRVQHLVERLLLNIQQLEQLPSTPEIDKLIWQRHRTWQRFKLFEADIESMALNAAYVNTMRPLIQSDVATALAQERQLTLQEQAAVREEDAKRREEIEQRALREKRRDRRNDIILNILLTIFSIILGWVLSAFVHLPF